MMLCGPHDQIIKGHEVTTLLAGTFTPGTWNHKKAQRPPCYEEAQAMWKGYGSQSKLSPVSSQPSEAPDIMKQKQLFSTVPCPNY